ncbi:hypothetical protein M231_05638 [Tremella mesenterica]|uniref:Uncharacterized protein n=1 Tax=Tremella mesenterica TaxID=5217 RepID=A0A4Q1BHI1_TREME|nr:uncharacterized protein TREMEDRAFT_60886 [Tremella mesenterica DSM 1558]EIW70389.1 hypothetical protein TREMEDRAFT_60886 [Tremella mesenterica DSM 1558]RXK37050.1 hypothetical protein M231_05638 [Tremella mesenterica]
MPPLVMSTQPSHFNITTLGPIDPSLAQLSKPQPPPPIDPSLFQIEQVVNHVRTGSRLDPNTLQPTSVQEQDGGVEEGTIGEEIGPGIDHSALAMEGEDIDPALREIVNSLTRAQDTHRREQQQAEQDTTGVEEEALHQSLQSTLDDLTSGEYHALLQGLQDPQSPYLIDPHPDSSSNAEAGPSTIPSKRGRGRPKGSRNKPKPFAEIKVKPPKPPSKPRGRPLKTRLPEDQAEYEQRKQDKAMGIQRARGRPRKFPGYLVREMRLKHNRAQFMEVIRQHEDRNRTSESQNREGEIQREDNEEGDDMGEENGVGEEYEWDMGQGHSLLDVVGLQQQGIEEDAGVPSADVHLDRGVMRVFELPQ